jgi:hypothetical protein
MPVNKAKAIMITFRELLFRDIVAKGERVHNIDVTFMDGNIYHDNKLIGSHPFTDIAVV